MYSVVRGERLRGREGGGRGGMEEEEGGREGWRSSVVASVWEVYSSSLIWLLVRGYFFRNSSTQSFLEAEITTGLQDYKYAPLLLCWRWGVFLVFFFSVPDLQQAFWHRCTG